MTTSKKKALITGITGQDGSYLAELLLAMNYEVYGVVRRIALEDPEHRMSRLQGIHPRLQLHAASLESYASLHQVVEKVAPDECYHLAAQSFVSYSFDDEFSTLNTNINGTHWNLDPLRDWGHARDYVKAMWLMLQQADPDDHVVATGEMHTVREFVELTFSLVGLDYRKYVVIDPALYRPSEVNVLQGNAAKARASLGWAHGVGFKALVREMLVADMSVRFEREPAGRSCARAGGRSCGACRANSSRMMARS